jgi:putative ABC transport system permease protein
VVGIGEIKFFNMFGLFFAYTQIGTTQDLLGLKADEVTDVIAFLPAGGELKTFADTTAGQLGDGVKVTTRESMGGFITGGIQLYSALFYGFIIILLGIVGLLIVNMVFAIGIERRREIGTLRAIGFSRASIVTVFVSEIGLVSAIFTAIGVGLGAGAVLLLTTVALHPKAPLDFVMGSEFFMKFEPGQLVWPLVTISAFTALVAVIPAVQAASVRLVELMAEK